MKKLLTAIVLPSAFLLAACGGSDTTTSPEPAETTTVTERAPATAEPMSETVTETESEDIFEDESTDDSTNTVGYLAMELAWEGQDDSTKEGNCDLYEADATGTVDLYMDFIDNDASGFDASIERTDVINFFDNNC